MHHLTDPFTSQASHQSTGTWVSIDGRSMQWVTPQTPLVPRRHRLGMRAARGAAIGLVVLAVLSGLGAIVDEIDPPRADASPSTSTSSSTSASSTSTSTTSTLPPKPRTGPEALPAQVPPTASGSVSTLEGLYLGDPEGAGMEALLTASLEDVHDYWTRVFEQADLAPPTVSYRWTAAGESVTIPCGERPKPSTDRTMVFCARDDKITIAVPGAIKLWNGTYITNEDDHSGWPAGDLSVAFLVAHEYAHNIQWELAINADGRGRRRYPMIATELHADCLAGVWANAAWRSKLIDDDDAAEAVGTAARVGDYDVERDDHHGTPAQRVDAFKLGYLDGAPAACNPLLATPAA